MSAFHTPPGHRINRIVATVFSILAWGGVHISAQEAQPVDTLNVALISADRWGTSKMENTGLTHLEPVDLKRGVALFSSPDVIKMLQNLPGVAQGLELVSGIYVRGGDGSDNLFLLDGVPLYQVAHLGGIFSSFNSELVDGIDFYKSGFPAGMSDRTSSVVSVHTSDGSPTDYSGSFSIGLLDGRFNYTGPIIKEKLFFNFGIRRSWLDAVAVPAIALYNKLSDEHLYASYSFHDVNFNLTWLISDKDKMHLRLFSGRDGLEYDNKTPKVLYGKEINRVTDRERLSLSWGNLCSSLTWAHRFSESFDQETQTYYSKGYSDILSDNCSYSLTEDKLNKSEMFERNIGNVHAIGLRSDGKFNTKHNSLLYGVDYKHHIYDVSKDCYNTALYDEHQLSPAKYGTDLISFYLADRLHLDKLTLNCGLHNTLFLMGKDVHYFIPQPRVNISYKANNHLSLKASYSVMAQTEHLLSSLFFDLPTNLWMPSTSEVKPTVSTQWAAGIHTSKSGHELDLEAYYKTMDNMLMFSGASSIFPPVENWEKSLAKGKGRSYGFEAEYSYSNDIIYAGLSYTLSWSERLFNKFYDKWFPDRYDNRHKLTLQCLWNISKTVEFSAVWNYHSGNRLSLPERAVIDDSGVPLFLFSYPYNTKLPDYHRLDLGINIKKLTKSGKKAIWSISLYNAYCRLNPIGAQFYQDKDSGKIKIRAIAAIPIIPSFSYTLKF